MMIVARHLLQVITEVLPSAASCCYKHSSVRSFSNAVALYKNMCTLPRLATTTTSYLPEFQKVSDRRPPFPPLEYWLNTVVLLYPVQRVVLCSSNAFINSCRSNQGFYLPVSKLNIFLRPLLLTFCIDAD